MDEQRVQPHPAPFESGGRDVDIYTTVPWGIAAAVAATVVVVPAAYLVLNVVAHQTLVSWLAALAVPLVALAATATRLAASDFELRRRSAVRVGLAALAGGALVLNLVSSIRPTFPQIAAALSDSDLPAGYERIAEERRGDRLCRDFCPRILRYYRVPAGATDPVRDVVLALYERGWTQEDAVATRGTNPAALKGDIRVHVRLDDDRLQVYLDAR